MNFAAPRLPTVLGSSAALVVAFISFVVQVSPVVCVMRAVAAFMVFAAFGIVIRYLLGDAAGQAGGETEGTSSASGKSDVEGIAPGTSVAELLAADEAERRE